MQQLTASMVQETGGYVGPPVKKSIKWVNPEGKSFEAYVYVKLVSYETAMRESMLQHAGVDYFASRIVSSICDEKGNPIFTEVDVIGDSEGNKKMCSSLFVELISVINEANGFASKELKN